MKHLALLIILLSSGCAASVVVTPDASTAPALASTEPSAASAPQSPGPFAADDLARIVIDSETVPDGMTVDHEISGLEALVQPLQEGSTFPTQPGFVDARMTRVGTSGPGSYWLEGGYITWTALYQAPQAAGAAFEVLISEHEADSGWGMERVGRPPFGEEGVSLRGPAYGFDTRLHVWRVGNLLLAAVGLGPETTAEELRSIAKGMVARAEPM